GGGAGRHGPRRLRVEEGLTILRYGAGEGLPCDGRARAGRPRDLRPGAPPPAAAPARRGGRAAPRSAAMRKLPGSRLRLPPGATGGERRSSRLAAVGASRIFLPADR